MDNESNTIFYSAQEHQVSSATIYQNDRAEITRKIVVDVKKGKNFIRVLDLPSCIEPESIHVNGRSEESSVYVMQTTFHEAPNMTPGDEELAVTNEIEILNTQSTLLKQYFKSLGSPIKPDDFLDFMDKYAVKLKDIQEKLDAARGKAEELINGRKNEEKQAARITILVLSQQDCHAELYLSYIVPNASWKPYYEVHLTIPTSGEQSKTKVKISYKCTIEQSTGEDWSNIKLFLCAGSTQDPRSLSAASAEEKKEEIYFDSEALFERPSERVPLQARVQSTWQPLAIEGPSNTSRSKVTHLEEDTPGCDTNAMPSKSKLESLTFPIGLATLQTNCSNLHSLDTIFKSQSIDGFESAVSSKDYIIPVPGLFEITSNHYENETDKRHAVTVVDLVIENETIDFEWHITPIQSKVVYLRCYIPNTSSHVLAAGSAEVFVNGVFTSKSTIPDLKPLQRFPCDLGPDHLIKFMEYLPQVITKQNTVVSDTNGSINTIVIKETTTTLQVIKFFNSRPISISKLTVYDKLKGSSYYSNKYDSRIKPVILEYTCPSHGWAEVALEWIVKSDEED